MRSLFLILSIAAFSPAIARKIPIGKNFPVKTLAAGIAAANNGDTIQLHDGVYKEKNLIIQKSIRLEGIGNPVLDGEDKYEILTISGTGITVRGIHFRNAGYSSMNDFAALKVINSNQVIIENNTFFNSYFAIHIANSTYSAVRNNSITGNNKSEQLSGNGIHLWKCSNMMVEKNKVSQHRDGIYFEFVTKSTIYKNHSEKNIRYGLHFMFSPDNTYLYNRFLNNGAGVAVMYSKNVRMEYNYFEKNWGASAYGILLKDITDSYIYNNEFTQNTIAIHMEGSSRIKIGRNKFQGNGWAIRVQASCDDNLFHHNNFHANSFDVGTNGSITLNKFTENYWDKYEGYDLRRDGIGDIPYHPVSMYSMIVEQNPHTLILFRSFMVNLMDKAERAIPSMTPENLADETPRMKPNKQ